MVAIDPSRAEALKLLAHGVAVDYGTTPGESYKALVAAPRVTEVLRVEPDPMFRQPGMLETLPDEPFDFVFVDCFVHERWSVARAAMLRGATVVVDDVDKMFVPYEGILYPGESGDMALITALPELPPVAPAGFVFVDA